MEKTEMLKFMDVFIKLCMEYPHTGYLEDYEKNLRPVARAYWDGLEKLPFEKVEAALLFFIAQPTKNMPSASQISTKAQEL